MEGGDTISLKGGWNNYQIIDNLHEGFWLLRCTSFVCKEDLGDLIYCEGVGDEIWIANYHAPAYELSLY